MKAFEPYVRQLEGIVAGLADQREVTLSPTHLGRLDEALDGQPSNVLREVVPLPQLRAAGAFFTNPGLAGRLVNPIVPDIERDITVVDPACGVGDLLLACARNLPISEDLEDTLDLWGARLKGSDVYPQFVRATKVRLLLLAITRGTRLGTPVPTIDRMFPQIRLRDSLGAQGTIPSANCIVLNPPYTKVLAPERCG